MAYSLNIGTIVEITFRGEAFGQTTLMPLHYRMLSGPTVVGGAAGVAALIADAQAQIRPSYLAVNADNWVLREITGQVISPVRYQRISAPQGSPSGTGNQCATLSTSAVVTKRGETANRHSIGSIHIPAVPGDAYDAGVLSVGYQTLLATFAATMDNGLSAGGGTSWGQIILNRASPAASVVLYNTAIQTTVRTMRRRVVGRGI